MLPLSKREMPETEALYFKLTNLLRKRIGEGNWAEDSQIPTEMELAKEYQISRGTVRQALNILVQEGLLEKVQGRGTFVRKNSFPKSEVLQLVAQSSNAGKAEKRIGLVLAQATDQFNLDILIGVEQAAKTLGYQLSFSYSEERQVQQTADIERLRIDRVAGMIIFPVSDVEHDEQLSHLLNDNVPFVLVDRYISDLDCDYVVSNNLDGAYRATEHLLIMGHTRIGFAYSEMGGLQTTSVHDRWKGYCKALQEYAIFYDETLLLHSVPTPGSSQPNVCDDFLARPERPSAVFAVNDAVAVNLIKAAGRCGITVPDELAVVGFDDVSYASHVNPALTTIAQPGREIGWQAGNLLLSRIEGRLKGAAKQIEVPVKLIVRESCGARLRLRKATSITSDF